MSNISEPDMLVRVTNALLNPLYKIPLTQLKKQEVQLIERNSVLHGNDQLMMRVGKVVWGKDVYIRNLHPFPIPTNPVHPSLKEEVKELLELQKEVYDTELPYIKGYIRSTLSTFHTTYDLLQLFPEALHTTLNKLSNVLDSRVFAVNACPEKMAKYQEYSKKYQDLIRLRLTKNLLIS